ncbi:MAG: zf-TFIIB domain-containing protein [Gemmatimonadota bacterium]|nr:MAG: zf-TFIIB domain-containing protein [Gemmatimonadota bacterium]
MTQSDVICVRCGKEPAKRAESGVPTCDNCERLLQASLKAKSEESRNCPVHSTEMTKEIVLNIVVDRCPSCQGIWLDGGELDLLKKAIKAGMSDDFARAMLLPW